MLLEKIFFNIVAISLVLVIFVKIIKKNDTNYFGILLLQLVGIAICFIELNIGINSNAFFFILRYVLSIIIPIVIIVFEKKGTNFSELISIVKAHIFFKLGNSKKAKEELTNLVNKYPNSYLGHKLLAEIYEKEGGMRKAIDEYVKAVDLKKTDTKSYFKIAKLLNELDKKDEAIEMLQNLLKIQPDSYDATILLGEMLCDQERFKEAASVYQEGLKYRSFDFELYYSLGIVYTRLNDFVQAKEMYEKAAEINTMLYEANYNLALIALIQKELDQAEEYFEKCLYDEELEPFAYYNLAKISVLKGDKAKAVTFLNKAIELDASLLEKAANEKVFDYIRQYITVSVKMDENIDLNKKQKTKSKSKLDERAKIARLYLEQTNELVDDIKENTNKQKIEEKVNLLINSERLRQEQEKDEILEEKSNNIKTQDIKQKLITDDNNE